MNKCYKLHPGSKDGCPVWYIKYEDGTEEIFPFMDGDTENEIRKRTQYYLMRKRTKKINKIINGK